MTAKNQTNWPPEKLEEWARPALAYSELVEIAQTATSNNGAKNRALEWENHETFAQACRWLRILRVNYPERFEKLISQADQNFQQEEKGVEKKADEISAYCTSCGQKVEVKNRDKRVVSDGITMVSGNCPNCYGNPALFIPPAGKIPISQIPINIPHGYVALDLQTRLRHADPPMAPEAKMTFLYGYSLVDLCKDMLNVLFREDLAFYPSDKKGVMTEVSNLCIGILEEKFGLKIKICENCEYYHGLVSAPYVEVSDKNPGVICFKRSEKEGHLSQDVLFKGCEEWAPKEKEVSEKK